MAVKVRDAKTTNVALDTVGQIVLKMLVYDVMHKEKVYELIAGDLRGLGVKYRFKKNAIKTEKPERSGNALRKVFKTHLSYLPLDVVNLSSGAIVHVPSFVSQAIAYLEQFLNQEGLFRKAGSQIRQKELIARVDNGGTLLEKHQAVDVANALKTFFRDLPEPLIPYCYHDLFVRCAMLKTNRIEALLLACILLPPHHLNTLAFFMDFLKKVSTFEKQNKMGIDNLAKVIGPNIMPLQEPTMAAVQARLEIHLVIVKILIDKAECIGVLSEHVTEVLTGEVIGSIEAELDRSDPTLHSKINKKKKHRSGSLTRKPHLSASNLNLRMINGLKKIVGKSGSPVDSRTGNTNSVPEPNPAHTPSIKVGKKRKVMETTAPLSIKKMRVLLEVMPDNTCLRPRHLFASPVSSNPNPMKDRSPLQKSKVRKYLSHKIHSETTVGEKLDKSKRLRLSLDRLVSRNKKVADVDTQSCKESCSSPRLERRWSSASSGSSSTKKRKTQSDGLLQLMSPTKENEEADAVNQKDYDQVFMDANVNLSDDGGEQVLQEINKSDLKNRIKCMRTGSRRSMEMFYVTKLPGDYQPSKRKSQLHTTNDLGEEYVRIPKSEYEEIKSRVSAIETRISQEFGCISGDVADNLADCSASKVQSEYEKTLEEASIENTVTADHLAKRLGKELKIRRSSEHKVIRSPSARKIGNLRRRSQEKPSSKHLSRNASWHIPNRSDLQHLVQTSPHLNNLYTKPIRSRPKAISTRPSSTSSESYITSEADPICSDETNARLNYLQEQLHTLISHTAEHTRDSLSDDDGNAVDNDLFDMRDSNMSRNVRRASSFHGGDFIDNSQYFNRKVRELKKTNSQQNIAVNNNVPVKTVSDSSKEKTITWKEADGYFKSDCRFQTPTQQTGRASVAKLRTQNAGMVLAKAKLFDETTAKASGRYDSAAEKKHAQPNPHRRQPVKLSRMREFKSLDLDSSPVPKRTAVPRRKHSSKSPKNNNAKLRLVHSPGPSPLIKMELTIVPQQNPRSNSEKRLNRRNSQKFENHSLGLAKNNLILDQGQVKEEPFDNIASHKENRPRRSPPSGEKVSVNGMLQESNINIYKPDSSATCKTPHIKRPLTLKTPKSSRSLARRPAVDSRRTPMKAVAPLSTPKRQSPRTLLKTRQLSRHVT
ncbi:uncharacterized protein LOC107265776 isoform X2 [Cephus cinctus]|uniref:Uncharacterized protein LOC107265776 isoform X2 n=1 Tax=Cephus cinctus TaxID=211228 RepID=A0AAJ7RDB9_CEPCN|nr:uncharacterized protein LOC107265776 isoform X2 [Cephus cinctus]